MRGRGRRLPQQRVQGRRRATVPSGARLARPTELRSRGRCSRQARTSLAPYGCRMRALQLAAARRSREALTIGIQSVQPGASWPGASPCGSSSRRCPASASTSAAALPAAHAAGSPPAAGGTPTPLAQPPPGPRPCSATASEPASSEPRTPALYDAGPHCASASDAAPAALPGPAVACIPSAPEPPERPGTRAAGVSGPPLSAPALGPPVAGPSWPPCASELQRSLQPGRSPWLASLPSAATSCPAPARCGTPPIASLAARRGGVSAAPPPAAPSLLARGGAAAAGRGALAGVSGLGGSSAALAARADAASGAGVLRLGAARGLASPALSLPCSPAVLLGLPAACAPLRPPAPASSPPPWPPLPAPSLPLPPVAPRSAVPCTSAAGGSALLPPSAAA